MTTIPAYDTAVLAGHGRRLAAALLDTIAYAVILGASGALGFFGGLAAAGSSSSGDDSWSDLGWILLGSVVGLAVGFVGWIVLTVWLVRRPGARNGQSLGKQIVGIRVARADHTPVGVGTALAREIAAKWVLLGFASTLISGLLGFLDGGALGFLLAVAVWYGPAFADDQRRALHDLMCSTRVVAAGAGAAAPEPEVDDLWPATP